uniref:PGG domain-containing protein n=1 Tax=Quercus lobata TaxID=97700 RepID=A0A7N2LJJ7_QUELO
MADRHVAYMKDTEGRTALHIAAYSGHKTIMKKILSSCPDCYELVDDKRGWNALHFAVNSFYPRGAVRLILQNSTLKSLWNEKDADGNTVLHHHSNSSRFILQLGNDPRLDQMAFNKQNLDAFDVVATNEEIGVGKFLALRKLTFGNLCLSKRVFRRMVKVEGKETIMEKDDIIEEKFMIKVERAAEAHLVVAALIATVTFAAGIAVPGGFVDGKDTDAGAAILRTNVAFKAFIISNSIAMKPAQFLLSFPFNYRNATAPHHSCFVGLLTQKHVGSPFPYTITKAVVQTPPVMFTQLLLEVAVEASVFE